MLGHRIQVRGAHNRMAAERRDRKKRSEVRGQKSPLERSLACGD